MKILREIDVKLNPGLLKDSWSQDESFILLPTPSPVDDVWINRTLSTLPPEYLNGHYGILTSGSTGAPKLIIGDKKRSESLALEINNAQCLDNIDTTILCLPLSYSYSLINQWLWAFVQNKKIVYSDGISDPKSLINLLKNEQNSMICFVGSQYLIFESYLPEEIYFENVKCINFAGGLFPQKAITSLRKFFPQAYIYHNYGCTEALPRLTIRKAENCSDPYVLGPPLKDISLFIDEDSKLKFKSPYSAVAICTVDEFSIIDQNIAIETGDFAEFLPNGSIKLLGRSNEIFKRYGEKISLNIIKDRLQPLNITPFHLYQTIDSAGEPGYSLVLAGNQAKEDYKSVLKCLRLNFKRSYWPLTIEQIDTLPIGLNGKIDTMKIKNQTLNLLWKQHL